MYMKIKFVQGILIFCLLLFQFTLIHAQNFTISGTLKDASNGEDLIGASVLLKDKTTIGASTNTYGFYSLTLPKGNYTLRFQYIGYLTVEETIVLDHDLKRRELTPESKLLEEVVVKSERKIKMFPRMKCP